MKEEISWIQDAQKNALKFQNRDLNICVHVFIDREDDLFTAHCLEFDIVVDGKTKKEVRANIVDAIVDHISFCLATNNEDKILNPAPKEYWNKFYFTARAREQRFSFPKEYEYENVKLPFLHNMIKEIEFNTNAAYA